MENVNYINHLITKKIFAEHVSVVFIFAVLTVILTFPVILNLSESAGEECGDKCHMMWRIWWTDFSFKNDLDFQHSSYIFYPNGIDIGGNVAYFTTFIGVLLVQFVDLTTTWNILWFSGFIFGGYGCYLLANHFNKNYLSSIIAGVIFTFTTYHMAHSLTHIALSMIVWLPIFVLFLFKLLEKQSKYYSIVGGIIFFLVSLTHLYYFAIITMFSIVFFAVYIFRQKKVSNKTFVTNFSILLTIGLISTSILFLSTSVTDEELPKRPIIEHIIFGVNLENLILPVPEHTTNIYSDDAMIRSFYAFFEKPFDVYQLQIENLVFLGYSVIFLSALAIIRYRQNHIWFWLLICGIFVLMSLGAELKIFHEPTGIILPDKVLYDTIPLWDEMRAPARFIVMANLSLAVLASFAVYGLIKNRFSSFKQQLMLTTIIGFVILFEFSMIPYPSYSQPIPDIYEEIKKDESKFAVLSAPLGGTGEFRLMTDNLVLYHQIYHEKPIYGGTESRASYETLENIQTYFLNMFRINCDRVEGGVFACVGSGNDDVIKQDLATHGLSLFDYFDIKYVILHKKIPTIKTSPEFIPETRQIMSEILTGDNPVYDDSRTVVYKIPKPNSLEPFLLLGSGWHIFEPEYNARGTMKSAEILIVNPTSTEMTTTLNLVIGSPEKEKTMTVSLNGGKIDGINIPTLSSNVKIGNLILKPGVNVVTLDADEYHTITHKGGSDIAYPKFLSTTLAFEIRSISLTN